MTEPSKEAALNKTLYALVKQVGLTPEEISQLKLADLKLAGQHPSINFVSPSTNQQKMVELDLDTHRSVVGWLVVRPDSMSELLFPGAGDEPMAPAEIEQAAVRVGPEQLAVAPKPQAESPSRPVTPVSPPVSRPVRPSFSHVPPPPPLRPGPFQTRPIKPPPAPPERGAPRPGVAPPPPPQSSAPPLPPEADSLPSQPPFASGPSRPVPRQAFPSFTDLPAPESTLAEATEPDRTGPAGRQAPPPPLHRAQPKHKVRTAPKPVRRREEEDSPATMPHTPEPRIPPVNVKPAGTLSSITAEEAAQIDAVMKEALETSPLPTEPPAAGPPPPQATPEAGPVVAADSEAALVSEAGAQPVTTEKQKAADEVPAGPVLAESQAPATARPTRPGVTTDKPKPPRWYRPEPGSTLPGPLGRTDRPLAMSFGIGGLIVLLGLCGVCVTTGWILDAQSEDGLMVDLGLADPTTVVTLPEEIAPTTEAAPALETSQEPALVKAPVSAVATPTLPSTRTPTSAPPTATPPPTDTPLPTDTPQPTETPTPVPTDTPEPTPTPEPVEEAPPETVEEAEPAAVEEPAFKFGPAVLMGPQEDEVLIGNNQPVLRWQPVELGEGEYYAVRMVYPFNGQPTYGGINTRETQWTVPLELYQKIDPPLNRYEWYVIIERSQDEGAIAVSPESERRHFIWR